MTVNKPQGQRFPDLVGVMALDPRGDGLTDFRIRYVIIGCHFLNRPHGGGYANLAGQDVSHSLAPDLVGVVPVLLFEGCMEAYS